MEKLERDGKVAVVYSPGFGAGWSSWSDGGFKEFLTMDKRIAEAVEAGDNAKALAIANEVLPDIYGGGADQLKIEWVEKGQAFEISEYDGSEAVRIIGDIPVLVA